MEPMYVELLSERLDITPSTVSFHLKKLMDCGIVSSEKSQYYVVYSINADLFDSKLIDLIQTKSESEDLETERQENYRKKVIDTFFEYGKLKSIPVQQKKRRIILEEIVKCFEFGKEYTEREVNINIADFHDDFCTLRREMIAEKLMDRKNGLYWKLKQ